MPSKSLPERASLAHLKYQAKDLLAAVKLNHPEAVSRIQEFHPKFSKKSFAPADVSLSDAQLCIAREYGFTTWAKLKERVAANRQIKPTRATLGQYAKIAEHLVVAFNTGDITCMQSVWKHFRHRRTWEAMRRYVLLDLGSTANPEDAETTITVAEAKILVARELGFESWAALETYFAQLPPDKVLITPKPVALFTTDSHGERHTIERVREWETIFESVRDKKIPGLNAAGQMTDVLVEQISKSKHLTSLDLSDSRALTDVGARYLAQMPQLEHLNLCLTGIGDRGVEILSRLPRLKTINLSWTDVTDAGVAHLSKCGHLERIDLAGTQTGDGAIKALAGKPRLAHFMSGAQVTDAGIKFLHDYPVFKTWRAQQESMALLSPEAKPNYLGLRGSFTNQGFADLAGLDGLFALNVDDSKLAITSDALGSIVGLPNLGWLAFDAKDDSMPYIAAMPKLRFLMCQDTDAGDDGFVALSRSKSIENIWGRRCYNLRSRGFRALAAMPSLRALSVSCKNVDDAGLSALPHFPALRELMPMDVPDQGYRYVGQCKNLDSLVLMYCRDTSDAATEHIAALPKLRKYFASYTKITNRSMEILSQLLSLEEITFYGCPGVTDEGVMMLAQLPRLRKLTASGQKITPAWRAAFPKQVQLQIDE